MGLRPEEEHEPRYPGWYLGLGVEVNYYPPCARAPLTSHPRTTLAVVDAPSKHRKQVRSS